MDHNRSNTEVNTGSAEQFSQEEISLADILRFVQSNWRVIALCGIAGLAVAIAHIVTTPKRYEATAQILTAQVGATSNNNNKNPLGNDIEEPSLVVARFSSPTSASPATIAACGLEGEQDAQFKLVKNIKLSIPKGISSVVELKVFGSSPEAAKSCALGVFSDVKSSQDDLMAPYLEEARVNLILDEERLAKAKEFLLKADQSGSGVGAAYLSTRDEIRALIEKIASLKATLSSSQNRSTRLVSPIYANTSSSSPQKSIVLIAGLLGGLFAGLLLVLAGKQLVSLKAQSNSRREDDCYSQV